MVVVLLSQDHLLYNLCNSILQETNSKSRSFLVLADPKASLPSADLYIWDSFSATARHSAAKNPHKHLLLVDRTDLDAAGRIETEGHMLVLKPVTKIALSTWLSYALENAHEGKHSANSSRNTISTLLAANLRFQQHEQDRTGFLARVSHDFRAPLTAMNGYCGLLLDGKLGPLTELQSEVLHRTQNSLRRLTRMTTGMLQIMVSGRVQLALKVEEGKISDCVEQAIHEIQPMVGDKRIQVTANLKPPRQKMYFDSSHLEQVLTNLLDNACRFTPKNGQIEISGYPFFWERRSSPEPSKISGAERRLRDSADPNAFRVDVFNTGPAITPDRLTRIFDEYASDREGGSGLGLAICKLIVQEHRGKIWAENRVGGPAFSFVLPLLLSASRDHQVLRRSAAVASNGGMNAKVATYGTR